MRFRGVIAALICARAFAQQPAMDHSHMDMSMDMPGMAMSNAAGEYLMNLASGTSMNPGAFSMPMAMPKTGAWNTMLMGSGFVVDTQQSGPRGRDKLYGASWFMGMAEHKVGKGSLMFEAMLSLDPATITNRRYPLLFQTGETAFGTPLVDAQHPHDFVGNLGIHYAREVGRGTLIHFYYAPVGDPALGPVAFPHRASASELPQATLGHHWQDSSHVAANVATVAVKHKWVRLEVSGFHGTEPDENRWNIDWGPMNSWAVRASVFPSPHWMVQVSTGHLVKPERQEEGNTQRTTASVHYTRGGWSSSGIWGHSRGLDSYLLESVAAVTKKDFVTGRFEYVAKDELAVGGVHPVKAYTAGYTHDVPFLPHVEAGIGANLTAFGIPQALRASYGEHPWGANVYMRFRLTGRR